MTGRLARYWIREVGGLYLIGVGALCLLLSIDLLSVLAGFLVEQQAGVAATARLLLYKIPWFLHLTLPLAVVFAILVASGRLARDAELKAAYAGGVPPTRLLIPLIGFGVAVSGVSLLVNGYLEPWGEAAYEREIQSFLYVRPPTASQNDAAFAIEGVGTFFAARLRADRDDPTRANLSGVLIALEDGRLITGASGVWNSIERTWTVDGARVADAEGSHRVFAAMPVPFPLAATPSDSLTRPQQQTLGELRGRVRELAAAGGAVDAATFALHRRLADASSAAVFAVAAGALALRVRARSGGLGITIALLVAFWALWTVTGTLFDRGVVGPIVAAWATPGLVGVAGAALAAWGTRR